MNKASLLRVVSLIVAAVIGGFVSQIIAFSFHEHTKRTNEEYDVMMIQYPNTDALRTSLNEKAKEGWKIKRIQPAANDVFYIIFSKER